MRGPIPSIPAHDVDSSSADSRRRVGPHHLSRMTHAHRAAVGDPTGPRTVRFPTGDPGDHAAQRSGWNGWGGESRPPRPASPPRGELSMNWPVAAEGLKATRSGDLGLALPAEHDAQQAPGNAFPGIVERKGRQSHRTAGLPGTLPHLPPSRSSGTGGWLLKSSSRGPP